MARIYHPRRYIATREHTHMRKALLLLLLFALGISMIANGCGTLLQALD